MPTSQAPLRRAAAGSGSQAAEYVVAADCRHIARCAIARVESPANRRSRYRFSSGFRSLYSLFSPRFQCEFCDHVGGTMSHAASRGAEVKSIHLLPWLSRARVHLEITLPHDIPHDIYHGYRQVHHMTKTAKLFRTGRSKAVRPIARTKPSVVPPYPTRY